MKKNDLPVTEDELHAYVDGELPSNRRAAVESWLAAHPEDASRVAGWRLQADAIRARYADVATQPIPRKLDLGRMSYASRTWKIATAASVAAALLLGGLTGWFARDSVGDEPNPFQRLTAQAIDAHRVYAVEVRHPVEVPANEAEHLQQWLSKRVGYTLKAPNLESQGLHLVGGRLLPMRNGNAAAFFMYENASGERFTIFSTRAETPNTALLFNGGNKTRTNSIYWVDGHVAYIVSGSCERKELWQVARAAYEQIEPRVNEERKS